MIRNIGKGQAGPVHALIQAPSLAILLLAFGWCRWSDIMAAEPGINTALLAESLSVQDIPSFWWDVRIGKAMRCLEFCHPGVERWETPKIVTLGRTVSTGFTYRRIGRLFL